MLNAIKGHYSIEFGEKVTDEVKSELTCNDVKAVEAVDLIHLHARTGQAIATQVYVTPVETCRVINGSSA